MTELADIFREYGPAYRQKYGSRMLPSHRQAMQAISQCRTEAMGGHIYYCDHCTATRYSYHSCKNRHCPKCQHEATQAWLAKQEQLHLPVSYFLLTFTLPAELQPVARSHQKVIYNLLFRASADASQQLAQDPRFVGGQIGMVGVLHTWGRDITYHPHVHYLVPGGGFNPDTNQWLPSKEDFLLHVKPLSRLFRAKFRDALRKTALFALVPAAAWAKEWVVHCQPVGDGLAALKYLAPYIHRVAISNNRILKVAGDRVTFRYQDSDTGQTRYCTLTAEEFIRRFLQHVLPKGFVKVRYYGFFSPGQRQTLGHIRRSLTPSSPQKPRLAGTTPVTTEVTSCPPIECCPRCGQRMRLVTTVKRNWSRPP